MKPMEYMPAMWAAMTVSAAAQLKTTAEARKFSDAVVAHVSEDRVREAFDLSKAHWLLPGDEICAVAEQTRRQMAMVADRFGARIGHEFIRRETAGQSLVRHVCLVKFECHAIRWLFTYYRTNAAWILNKIMWDDNLDEMFQPAP